MINGQGVSVTFPTKSGPVQAVKDVSLEISKGEIFGIVGESGSGKTTLMRALIGQLPTSTGKITIDGEKVRRKASLGFRRNVQMVMQDCYGSLNPSHTIDQIIGEPLAIHRLDRPEARIVAALEDVGLGPSQRFRFPHQLSGGQRQRVGIARCLVMEPKIMFLDEPTSALDVSVQAEVVNLIMELARKRDLTMVMVSHDLALVAHMCDRLAVMRNGAICEVLTSAALRNEHLTTDYTKTLVAASKSVA